MSKTEILVRIYFSVMFMYNWSMIVKIMRCCQNCLLEKDILSWIIVSIIVRTFNIGARTNQHSTRGCFVYLILCFHIVDFIECLELEGELWESSGDLIDLKVRECLNPFWCISITYSIFSTIFEINCLKIRNHWNQIMCWIITSK